MPKLTYTEDKGLRSEAGAGVNLEGSVLIHDLLFAHLVFSVYQLVVVFLYNFSPFHLRHLLNDRYEMVLDRWPLFLNSQVKVMTEQLQTDRLFH